MVDNFNLVWDSYHLAREHGGGRERLGDERERRRAAEALAVPEGWKVEWSWENTTHHGDHTYSAEAVPRLVPLSPTDTPEEA